MVTFKIFLRKNTFCYWRIFNNYILVKGNAQFIFLCNPRKSGASRVCITFLQITQQILTIRYISLDGTDHWISMLSTSIHCKKNNHSAFLIFQKLCQKIDKKNRFLAYFRPLKVNYWQFMRLITLHCFFLTLVTVFSYV